MPDASPDITLLSPLAAVPGITNRTADDLAALGLRAVGQLLAHLPSRHELEHEETTIEDAPDGQIIAVRGEITATAIRGYGRKQRFEAVLHDGSARLDLVWFNAPYLRNKIGPGSRLWVQGKLRLHGTKRQLANPRFEILSLEGEPERAPGEQKLRPVYPASERIKTAAIERAVQRTLPFALPLIDDHLDDDYRRERNLPTLADAYRMMHEPKAEDEPAAARRRLAYDELLMLQLGVFLKRAHLRGALTAPALRHDDAIDARIRERIPFDLTDAQNRVVADIADDLAKDTPTNRLIQGDVGSGKTAVALYALLMAVASGHQGALMAPTEILAEQHFASLSKTLEGSNVRLELLTGSLTDDDARRVRARVARGETDILIGTHAVLTDRTRFNNLAVAIIDEQHRFGVHQRAALRSKGAADATDQGPLADRPAKPVTPHVLVMTATPIPRTLAMTLFGDLDVSTIDALPPGRQRIETTALTPADRREADTALLDRINAGDQAYVVVPAIDEADPPEEGEQARPGRASVRAVMRRLERGPLKGKRVAALHGRLRRAEREHIMQRFRSGLIDCLVATTVIEVGVDVPNATLIIIEDADLFGLAQLHQLRGRVGRGSKPSRCILIADPTTDDGRARLDAMTGSTDGFKLAERDMQIRGPGELFGLKQSGLPPFQVADLGRDLDLLGMARRDARAWIARSPTLADPTEALVRKRLLKRYGQALGLGDVG